MRRVNLLLLDPPARLDDEFRVLVQDGRCGLGLALADPVARLDHHARRAMVIGMDHLRLVERKEDLLPFPPTVSFQLQAQRVQLVGRAKQLGVVGLVKHRKELDAPGIAPLLRYLSISTGTRR